MKANLLTEEHREMLLTFSFELFDMYKRFKADHECVDIYAQLNTIWQAIDSLLELNDSLNKILPF